MRQHLVIIKPCYLNLISTGKKTVECRASRYRRPPFSRVSRADLLWLKLSSGAVVARCSVSWCQSLEINTPSQLRALKTSWARHIRADRCFWQTAGPRRYWTLIGLGKIQHCQPFLIGKRDRRSWVVLNLDESWWRSRSPIVCT